MKDLLILIDNLDLKILDQNLLDSCDRLALSPSAVVAFEQNKLSYLDPDYFYSNQQFAFTLPDNNFTFDPEFVAPKRRSLNFSLIDNSKAKKAGSDQKDLGALLWE